MRLAIDVGQARVGVAKCDPMGILASPVETIARDVEHSSDVDKIVDIANELKVIEIIIGLPKLLSGKDGTAVNFAQGYAKLIACRLPHVSVRLLDERLSTVRAHETLRANGIKTIKHRKIIDQVAAVDILQHALDTEKNTGKMAGHDVTCPKNKEFSS